MKENVQEKHRSFFSPMILVLGLILTYPSARAGEDTLQDRIVLAKNRVYPALVNIQVIMREFAGGRSRKTPAAGSGVIVSPDGHVLTNFHVAGHTVRIVCHLTSGEAIPAEVVVHDPWTDLSVLRLRLEERKAPSAPVAHAVLGDSDALEVGDYVLAMGNPLTLSNSTTLGIVSNTHRVFTNFTGTEMEEQRLDAGETTGLFTRWIQHDALILPGNSGGPLTNLRGEVVGINELGGNGMAFAIPSNLAKEVLKQALAYGEVRRGWFGLSLYPVGRLGLEEGALVSWVVPGGPADRAGLRAGDLLLSVDDTPVRAAAFEEIPLVLKMLSDFAEGSTVRVGFLRDGKAGQADLTVEAMEPYLGEEAEIRHLGLTVQDITGPMAVFRRYPDDRGVVVTGVRPGRPGDEARPRLAAGDVVYRVNGAAVEDLAAFREAVKSGRGNRLVFSFRRRGAEMVTVLEPRGTGEATFGAAELPRAWIGIRTQVLTSETAEALGLSGRTGFLVTQVYPETEAAAAGLLPGDVILALDGAPVRASRLQDRELLDRRIRQRSPGERVRLTVLREGAEQEVTVTLQASPPTAAEAARAEETFLEFKVRDLVFSDRIRNQWPPDQAGVLVVEVTRGGWAQVAGLRAGDLILSVMDRPVPEVKAFRRIMQSVERDRPERIKVFVRRSYRTAFVIMEPAWPEEAGTEPAKGSLPMKKGNEP